ncbi:MAG: type IV pilin protein [Candidatus Omnitrophica bacterium]|nr:type IV pilin protein [Candidatus Omnitrophota bacterium]
MIQILQKDLQEKEFLPVAGVAAVIMAVVIFYFFSPREMSPPAQTREVQATQTLHQIQSAMDRCFLQNNGTYVGCDRVEDLDMANPHEGGLEGLRYTISEQTSEGYTVTVTQSKIGVDEDQLILQKHFPLAR